MRYLKSRPLFVPFVDGGRRFRDVEFVTIVGQIGSKWNESETFSDQILVHFGLENYLATSTDLVIEVIS